MKKIIIYLSIILISNIYAQCDDYSLNQCNNDTSCEWIEDIEIGNCGNLWGDDCELNPECNWNCDFVDDYMGWCNYSCDGGPYEIDNSYCQEMEILECSGLLIESNCNHIDECEWVEDIEIGQCSQFDNSENSCTDYPGECFWDEDITYASCDYPNSGSCNSAEGCYWNCSDYGWYCDCYGQQQIIDTECIGQYEIDNSYCQEAEMPECSEMNELECSGDDSCYWMEDIDYASCSDLSIPDCSQYFDDGCILNSDCIQWGSWYSWICYEYGPSYCTGGSYQLDNSYCEQNEYQLGDLNQDSLINIQDVILAINLILNGEFDLSADINLDSIVNVLDVIQIVNIILSN